jgi:DNA-binding LacI/PurR family transcriptional regulator
MLVEIMRAKRVDGLIIDKEDMLTKEVLKLAKKKYPFILINGKIPETENTLCSVCINNVSGAYQATEYLIKLGHRRIGFITRKYESIPLGFRRKVDADRLEGYRLALEEHRIEYEDSLVKEGSLLNKDKIHKAVNELLKLNSPPTAIFVSDDTMALGVVTLLQVRGFKVPEDISIIGYHNLPLASFVNPSLTTVQTPLAEMGRLATEMLIKLLKGERIENPKIVLKTHLVTRESCREISSKGR